MKSKSQYFVTLKMSNSRTYLGSLFFNAVMTSLTLSFSVEGCVVDSVLDDMMVEMEERKMMHSHI